MIAYYIYTLKKFFYYQRNYINNIKTAKNILIREKRAIKTKIRKYCIAEKTLLVNYFI